MLPREIVSAFVSSDRNLPPKVRRAVLARGASAVPTLCRLLDEDPKREPRRSTGWGAIHAMRLLAELGAVDAIPAIVEVLVRADPLEIRYNAAIAALIALGDAVAEPLLTVPPGSDDFECARDEVLAHVAPRDPRVLARLVAGLERAPGLYTSLLVTQGDPDSLPALSAALDRLPLSADPMTARTYEELLYAIRALGGSPTAAQDRKTQALIALMEDENRRLRAENERLGSTSKAIEGYFRNGSDG